MSKSTLIMGYIMVVWFVISFVTNLLGPLMPIIIGDFHLSLALAGFLPFSFFLAYGLISIPAGALVEARGPRTTLLAAFTLNLTGCLAIVLTASHPPGLTRAAHCARNRSGEHTCSRTSIAVTTSYC